MVMLNAFIEYIGLHSFDPTCNLCAVTMKQLQKQLEERLGMDLSNKKALIKKLCKEFFEKKHEKMREPDKQFRVKTEVSHFVSTEVSHFFPPLLCLAWVSLLENVTPC